MPQRALSGIHPGSSWPLGSSLTRQGVNFVLAAPGADRIELLLYSNGNDRNPERVIELDGRRHRSGDYWHVEVEGVGEGCCYGYRVFGPLAPGGHGFQPSKVLLDPTARAISGWDVYDRVLATGPSPNAHACLKAVVCERDLFDFQAHPRPRHSWQSTVIYELHVGGFTRREDAGVAVEHRGTYLGLIEKLPYLKELGITAVELLPVFCFDPADAPPGRDNVWGYSPLSWFTPHHDYCCSRDPLQARHEVRQLVAACHDAGIEVLLDVVYNHTTEGNRHGPTLSWRGCSDNVYYHQNEDGDYQDVSGCGNSIAANAPITTQLILESMRCWALELGVDGFRFDLGIALSRGDQLKPLNEPPLFAAMEADPQLSDLKLVSEPWDCGGLYRLDDFPAKRIGTWNGHFRDGVRRFWKGDDHSTWSLAQRFKGSPDLYDGKPVALGSSVNFITAHDGFTLADLVSYNRKHNLANGEDNRDGENHNNSWNHGIEGPSSNALVQSLRRRQQRNLLSSLLLARGVPMLLMGDEVGRSQGGNNNSWCQNSPLGWMVWDEDHCDLELKQFLQRLLRLRQALPQLFNPLVPPRESNRKSAEQPSEQRSDLWRQWHGVNLAKPDWAAWSRTTATSLHRGSRGALLWMGFNAYKESLSFELPVPASPWKRVIDTSLPSPKDFPAEPARFSGVEIPLQSRSFVLLIAEEEASGLRL
ncbi:Alpha amylase, catalytic subdomain protein [Synechococcus sp. WH 8109]|uniref:glycogen debranching protein n=1 Tax=Synechococcus sp. WH 8109 TaxID=166314 RepID=UPI0001B8E1CD|nr:isoamylase [Synechococcus sp. WH 8109]AHF64511.1 Alpha amylase, catalytic subdomain protein [Synechococcus sp. WH 8109]